VSAVTANSGSIVRSPMTKTGRKVSANGVWWILQSAFNHASREKNLPTVAWDAVKGFE